MELSVIIKQMEARDGGDGVAVSLLVSDGEHREEKTYVIPVSEYLSWNPTVGMPVSLSKCDELEEMDREYSAMKLAVSMVNFTANSPKQIVYKLVRKGVDKAVAFAVADRLVSEGMISVEDNIRAVIRQDLSKKWGKRRILSHLYEKGYPKTAVQNVTDDMESDIDWFELCRELYRGKYKTSPADAKEKQKRFATLYRYGYTTEQIQYAMEEE